MQEEDSAWKEVLEDYFHEFLELLFPAVDASIDWQISPEWLDKEFQAIFPGEDGGRRIVDKLAKIHLRCGEERWILVHVEVQGQSEPDFNERMFRYNVLIRFRYHKEVVSLGVLTDEAGSFRPGRYVRRSQSQVLLFRFPTVKLLDYERRRKELEGSGNPFAFVVLAHLDSRKARTAEARFAAKFALARRLYRKGSGREDVIRLYRFLDWLLRLPQEMELELLQRIRTELEGRTTMPYLATFERLALEKGREEGRAEGREEGREEGLREAVRLGLKLRFGKEGLALLPAVEAVQDAERLRQLIRALERVERLEDLRALLESA